MPFLANTPGDLSTARNRLQMAPSLALHLERNIRSLTPLELARLEPWAVEMVKNMKRGDTDRVTPYQALGILTAVAVAIAAVYHLAPPKKETIPFSPTRTEQSK